MDPNLDISLEGFLDCNVRTLWFPSPGGVFNWLQTFDTHTTNFYNSAEFQQMAKQSAAFLDLLPPYLDGRSVSLENMVRTFVSRRGIYIESDMVIVERTLEPHRLRRSGSKTFYQIYDYMNVNSIHNVTFAKALPPTFLAQASALANWHEYNVFTDPSVSGIGNSESYPHGLGPSSVNPYISFSRRSSNYTFHSRRVRGYRTKDEHCEDDDHGHRLQAFPVSI